jgi:hypothetical protein
MLATIYFLIKLVKEEQDDYWKILGLSLGGALLVKAPAFILVGILLLLIKFNANFKKSLVLSLFIFSPVIVFNLGMYFLTGYADSLFVRILPGAKNPFATPVADWALLVNPPTIFFLLMDLYSPLVFGAMLVAFIWASVKFFRTQNFLLGIILLSIIASVAFFIPGVVRAYYLPFVTPFLVMILAHFFVKKHFWLLAILIVFWSLWYSFRSNLDTSYALSAKFNDSGRSNYPLLLPLPIRDYSLASRSWSQDWGWKNIVNYLKSETTNYCLVLDPDLDSIALRRYLWYKDEVKRAFVGEYLPPRFPLCNDRTFEKKYFLTKNGEGAVEIK